MSAPPGHGVDLARERWEPGTGALVLRCECGYVVRDFPPAPFAYSTQLAALEAGQIARFRRHLEEVAR